MLNAPALAVVEGLKGLGIFVRDSDDPDKPTVGAYVITGDVPDKPRADLNLPWKQIAKRARLDSVRLHDLRHTDANFGAGSGLGRPVIGKLHNHKEAPTMQRYVHLDSDHLRRAANEIGGRIAKALGEGNPKI